MIGAQIKFIYERKPLGTAGSISKVPFSKSQNLIVLNADLMLSVNFNYLVDEHMNSGSDLTLVSTHHKIKVDYGVIAHEVKSKRVLNFLEKPSWIVDVYSGICIMNSKVTKLVPKNSVMDIPKLVSAAMKKKLQIRQLDLNGYWLDIGTHENIKELNTKLKSEISH